MLLDLRIVDERAMPGPSTADHESVPVAVDLRMVAGHFSAREVQIATDAAADQERHFLDRDDSTAKRIGYPKLRF